MYSVVVPTLWVPDTIKFKNLLNEVNTHPLVKEIILIDNSPDVNKNIKQYIIDNLDKLIHIRMEENIYVNPAWNLGVETSNAEFIILLNDDFFTDVGVSQLIDLHNTHLDKNEALYGISGKCYEEFISNDPPTIDKDGSGLGGTGWACFIILPKKNYPIIPNDLKIWFGDDFILRRFIEKKLPMYSFINLRVLQISTTVNSVAASINKILEDDGETFFSKYDT